MKKGWLSILLFVFWAAFALQAQNLEIETGDAYIDQVTNKGFHLWIRQKEGMGSVLLTDSTADPAKRLDSYALRAWEYNSINGDEKRILNGVFLPRSSRLFFLVDSTPEYNEILKAQAFHIYVPLNLTWGYPWSREGQNELRQGSWLNIRTFEKPYADYSGPFQDNPFTLSARFKEIPPPVEKDMLESVMEEAALMTGGEFITAEDGDVAVDKIEKIISSMAGGSIDIALVIDTTVSMKNDVNFIRKKLISIVKEHLKNFDTFRIGIVLYRDYKEAYLTREVDFLTDLAKVQWHLDHITVSGGRDIPEAVYEGLFSAVTGFDWAGDHRIIIQIGDAPPHAKPRGEITRDMVYDEASNLGIAIYPILLPSEH